MAAIPTSALIEQFAGEITPAGQAVFGLNAQPFENDHGAHLGEVHDSDRGNVQITLARKAALVSECRRLGLNTAGTTAVLRSVIQRANTQVLTQIAADWPGFTDAEINDGLTDPTGVIDLSAMSFNNALIEITASLAAAPTIDAAAFAAASNADKAGLLRLAKQAVIRLRRITGAPPPGAAPPPAGALPAAAGGALPPGVGLPPAGPPPAGLFGSAFGGAPTLGHTASEPFVKLIETRALMVTGAITDEQLSVLSPVGDGDGIALSRKAVQLLNRDTQAQILDKALAQDFHPEQWAKHAVDTLAPKLTPAAMPSHEQLGAEMAQLVETKLSAEVRELKAELEVQINAQSAITASAQESITRTMHGMGAEFGTQAEQGLNLERIRTHRDLTTLREVKKEAGESEKLNAAIVELEKEYNILNLVREDVNHDGLDILEFIRKKKLSDPTAEATYSAARKEVEKQKKRRLEIETLSRGGQKRQWHGGGAQPNIQQRFGQLTGGGVARGAVQQQLNTGALSGANAVGMGRGAGRVQPAWMTAGGAQQGAQRQGWMGSGSGQPQFIQFKDGQFRIRASSGKTVYFPDQQRCLTASCTSQQGSTDQCWFCEQQGHIAFECPKLRQYHQAGQLNADGTPTNGPFPL